MSKFGKNGAGGGGRCRDEYDRRYKLVFVINESRQWRQSVRGWEKSKTGARLKADRDGILRIVNCEL